MLLSRDKSLIQINNSTVKYVKLISHNCYNAISLVSSNVDNSDFIMTFDTSDGYGVSNIGEYIVYLDFFSDSGIAHNSTQFVIEQIPEPITSSDTNQYSSSDQISTEYSLTTVSNPTQSSVTNNPEVPIQTTSFRTPCTMAEFIDKKRVF